MSGHGRVGKDGSWVHTETVETPKAGDNDHAVTPESGRVRISYVDDDGATRYWNGSTFAVGAPVNLATSVSGFESTYSFTYPNEVRYRNVCFEGEMERNGYYLPTRSAEVFVVPVEHAGYYVD